MVIDQSGSGKLIDCPTCRIQLEVPHGTPLQRVSPRMSSRFLITAIAILTVVCVGLFTLVIANHYTQPKTIGTTSQWAASSSENPIPEITPQNSEDFKEEDTINQLISSTTLNGEIFIVTNSGVSVKLGLVPVLLIASSKLTPWLAEKELVAAREITRLDQLIKTSRDEDKKRRKVREEDRDRLEIVYKTLRSQRDGTTPGSREYLALSDKIKAVLE